MKSLHGHIWIAASLMTLQPVFTFAHNHDVQRCNNTPHALLDTADFNGDGLVDRADLRMVIRAAQSGEYYSLYDRNADGKINHQDISHTARSMGKQSSFTDQQVAQLYEQLKVLQTVRSPDELYRLGFEPITGSLAGHGEHWANTSSDLPVSGINVPEDASAVWGVYFSIDARPLFNDSASESGLSPLDYPAANGAWMYERVQAFNGVPPTFFPDSEEESWHTHAGLCITLQDYGASTVIQLDQHMSYMECQSLPSLRKIIRDGVEQNAWFNIWMLHLWMFELNPHGLFANTHPCLDPHAPDEADINGDRTVPPFFSHH